MPSLIPQNTQGANNDPLANLRDIHLPEETITQLPVAPGWWILLTVAVLTIVSVAALWKRHKRRNQYRAAAQTLLNDLVPGESNTQVYVQKINSLLKRTAQAAYPNTPTATHFGSDWVDFLKNSAPDLSMPEDVEDCLLNSSYQRPDSTSADSERQQQILTYADRWLTQHKPERRLNRLEANV